MDNVHHVIKDIIYQMGHVLELIVIVMGLVRMVCVIVVWVAMGWFMGDVLTYELVLRYEIL